VPGAVQELLGHEHCAAARRPDTVHSWVGRMSPMCASLGVGGAWVYQAGLGCLYSTSMISRALDRGAGRLLRGKHQGA